MFLDMLNFIQKQFLPGVKTITGIAGVNNNTPQLNIRNVDDIK